MVSTRSVPLCHSTVVVKIAKVPVADTGAAEAVAMVAAAMTVLAAPPSAGTTVEVQCPAPVAAAARVLQRSLLATRALRLGESSSVSSARLREGDGQGTRGRAALVFNR